MFTLRTFFVVLGALFFTFQCAAGQSESNCDDAGEPLYLSPYIECGQIEDAKKAAEVPPLLDNITSYSGFLTVDKETDSNIFFWFFPAEESPSTAPVAVWLQGGPGCSSMFAVFKENGPFYLDEDGEINRRSAYWSQKLNMIFIDQPVGTGFSFTRSPKGYANSEDDVSRNVYAALLQFFQLFPEYSENEFYLTGESYAGKYIPSVAYWIHQMNPNASQKINLKGMAIGNGWVDPYNMIDYSTLLYGLDFIDLKTRNQFAEIEDQIRALIEKQDYQQANSLFGNYFERRNSLTTNTTQIVNIYNFLELLPLDDDIMIKFLNSCEVRELIHVGNLAYVDQSSAVFSHLHPEHLLSTMPKLEALMDDYKVLLFSGQLDIICAYSLTMNYVRKLQWKGTADYNNAERQPWYVGRDVAGYRKTAGNFTELLVRNAGHMVPGEQPVWAFEMISNFIFNKPFANNPYDVNN